MWETFCQPKSKGKMGFKDLALFNDSLLAKQAWRLFNNKESLFHRFFKSKFFPNGTIMEASEFCSGSYAWRSILKGRDVLLTGARWRVGSGDSISVWNDAWLPLTDHPRIQSEAVTGFEHMKVSELIHPVSMQWDINPLNGLFSPQEVHLITSIPLGRFPTEDKYIWPYTSSSLYTVKSGSSFLVKRQCLNFS